MGFVLLAMQQLVSRGVHTLVVLLSESKPPCGPLSLYEILVQWVYTVMVGWTGDGNLQKISKNDNIVARWFSLVPSEV